MDEDVSNLCQSNEAREPEGNRTSCLDTQEPGLPTPYPSPCSLSYVRNLSSYLKSQSAPGTASQESHLHSPGWIPSAPTWGTVLMFGHCRRFLSWLTGMQFLAVEKLQFQHSWRSHQYILFFAYTISIWNIQCINFPWNSAGPQGVVFTSFCTSGKGVLGAIRGSQILSSDKQKESRGDLFQTKRSHVKKH